MASNKRRYKYYLSNCSREEKDKIDFYGKCLEEIFDEHYYSLCDVFTSMFIEYEDEDFSLDDLLDRMSMHLKAKCDKFKKLYENVENENEKIRENFIEIYSNLACDVRDDELEFMRK